MLPAAVVSVVVQVVAADVKHVIGVCELLRLVQDALSCGSAEVDLWPKTKTQNQKFGSELLTVAVLVLTADEKHGFTVCGLLCLIQLG